MPRQVEDIFKRLDLPSDKSKAALTYCYVRFTLVKSVGLKITFNVQLRYAEKIW